MSLRFLISAAVSVPMCVVGRLAPAWERDRHEDAEVVERSVLIVVGHLDKASIVYSPPESTSGVNRFSATLVVTEVLRGHFDGKEIPIFINHGLAPAVDGRLDTPSVRWGRDDGRARDEVPIMDIGGNRGTFVVDDAIRDHVWFLRYLTGELGRDVGGNDLGIVDPEDVGPAALKEYYAAYLTDEPVRSLKALAAKDDEVATRVQRYLDHLAVREALTISLPWARIEALVPYCAAQTTWGFRQEAVEGIVACGRTAGPTLLRLFDDPAHRADRLGIIKVWDRMGYGECVETLVRLLEKNDEFWARLEPLDEWWTSDADLPADQKQRFEEVRAAVLVLNDISDPRAETALELTRKRWEGRKSSSPQVDHVCKLALEKIRKQKKGGED